MAAAKQVTCFEIVLVLVRGFVTAVTVVTVVTVVEGRYRQRPLFHCILRALLDASMYHVLTLQPFRVNNVILSHLMWRARISLGDL